MDIRIIRKKITHQELTEVAQANFGDMVKGVVDIKNKIIALGGELHADAEAVLLENGSLQDDLWGFNIYPDKSEDQRIQYSSLINIRPAQGARSIEIQDQQLKNKMKEIIDSLIE